MISFTHSSRGHRFLIGSGILVCLTGAVLIMHFSDLFAQSKEHDIVHATSQSEAKGEECMKSIREVYARMAQPPGADSTCAFTCRAVAYAADTTRVKNSVATIDYLLNQQSMQITSDLFAAYRDSNDVFTVIPNSRTIFRSDARKSNLPVADITALRDSLLAHTMVGECREVRDSGGTVLHHVQLIPDPRIHSQIGIAEMEMIVDMQRHELKSIIMIPQDSSMYRRMEWTFSPFVYGPATDEFRQPVAHQFMAGAATLTSKWKGYTIVDNRMLAQTHRSK